MAIWKSFVVIIVPASLFRHSLFAYKPTRSVFCLGTCMEKPFEMVMMSLPEDIDVLMLPRRVFWSTHYALQKLLSHCIVNYLYSFFIHSSKLNSGIVILLGTFKMGRQGLWILYEKFGNKQQHWSALVRMKMSNFSTWL